MVQEFKYSGSYDDPLLAELYDQSVTDVDDVELLRRLTDGSGPLNILECFSGTGRILVPLAQGGHKVTGIEMAAAMSARAAAKVAQLGGDMQDRVTLRVQDVLDGNWRTGYDLVIIGANAFYELPAAQMQEQCIRFAREALVEGGWLYVDNDDYKRDWGQGLFGQERVIFEGTGVEGAYGRYSVEGLAFGEEQRVLVMKRKWFTRTLEGVERHTEYLGRKHPVSAGEVESWLQQYGFQIVRVYGDRQGNPYTKMSDRAVFWARKVHGVTA